MAYILKEKNMIESICINCKNKHVSTILMKRLVKLGINAEQITTQQTSLFIEAGNTEGFNDLALSPIEITLVALTLIKLVP